MPLQYMVEGRGNSPLRCMLATQEMSGRPHAPFNDSLLRSLPLLADAGWTVDMVTESGNCHVDDARNSVVKTFLASKCTDLVFIDADVGWEPEGLVRLLAHDADVVAGIYPKRQNKPDFPVRNLPGEIIARHDGLVEVEGVATGFLRIRRSVIEAMAAAHENRKFKGSEGGEGFYYPIFERRTDNFLRRSGDYAFCHKWREMGGKIFVDPEIDFIHEGYYQWSGRLGDHWRKQAGLESHRFCHAFRQMLAGDFDANAFVDIYLGWDNPYYSAKPELLAGLHGLANKIGGPILETGAGLSSMVMAAAGAEVWALESDLEWYRRICRARDQFGLENLHVLYRPLDENTGWYSGTIPDQPMKMVVCDGPKRVFGSRDKVWSLRNVEDAVWVIDDSDGAVIPGRTVTVFGEDHKWIVATKAG